VPREILSMTKGPDMKQRDVAGEADYALEIVVQEPCVCSKLPRVSGQKQYTRRSIPEYRYDMFSV
jgi:hypothetical protein